MKCGIKVVSIVMCLHCPYAVRFVSDEPGYHLRCSLTFLNIEHPGYIQDWCPLEDYKWTEEQPVNAVGYDHQQVTQNVTDNQYF